MAFTPVTKSKTAPGSDPDGRMADQMDNLQNIAAQEKIDVYGADMYAEIRALYTLNQNAPATPRFRPRVTIPELQTLALLEANDLSDIEPRPYLIKSRDTFDRDDKNEVALQAQGRDAKSYVLLRWLEANLWAFLCGDGFIQVGYDPYCYNGRGSATVECRDPETVFPDPYAMSTETWKYVMWEDYMWLDEVKLLYPERAWKIAPPRPGASTGVTGLQSGRVAGGLSNLSFPSGPMRSVGNLPTTPTPGDARVKVRTLWVYDPAVVELKGKNLDDTLKAGEAPEPKFKQKYPKGRLVIESERIVLYDNKNPRHDGKFPLVRTVGMPSIHGFWAPPPVRYTRSIQEMAERLYTQIFENIVRTNNLVWFIPEDTGIDSNKFGGVPGEVQFIAAGSKPPTAPTPPQIGQFAAGLPEQLFALQRRIQGFPETRKGEVPAGNVSPGFLEAAVSQSHGLTKLRAKYQVGPLRELYYLLFSTMAQYYQQPRKFYNPNPGVDKAYVEWTPIPMDEFDNYDCFIDPDSIQPASASAWASKVPLYRNMGLMSIKQAARLSRMPDADQNFQELQEESQAAAQAEQQKDAAKKAKNKK